MIYNLSVYAKATPRQTIDDLPVFALRATPRQAICVKFGALRVRAADVF